MSLERKLSKDMRAKIEQYLEGIAHADEKLHQLEMEIERLEQVARGCGAIKYDKERVQTTPQNTVEDNIIKLVEAKHDLELMKSALATRRAEGYKYISKLSDSEYQIVNDMYFKNIPIKKIAIHRHYSLRTAQRLHTKALMNIADILIEQGEIKDGTFCRK